MSLPYDGKLIRLAGKLRRNATPQENHLWHDFLKLYPVRFQRQKVIGGYIADFYRHAAKLVIEVDGSQHYLPEGIARDTKRSAALERNGLAVLRFSNREINTEFRAVCERIDLTVRARTTGSHE